MNLPRWMVVPAGSLTVEERVENGTSFLDENYPLWWTALDLETLALSSANNCVLGQVGAVIGRSLGCFVPDEESGYGVLTLMHRFGSRLGTTYDLGFYEPFGEVDDLLARYEVLEAEWKRVIRARIATPADEPVSV